MRENILNLINNGQSLKQQVFQRQQPELYLKIMEWQKENSLIYKKWSELVWLIIYGLDNRPKCVSCGAETDFIDISQGWKKHCQNTKCRYNDPVWLAWKLEQDQNGLENKYGIGIRNPSQIPDWKDKVIKKSIEKTGHQWHTQTVEHKQIVSETILKNVDKIKDSLFEKYGTKNPSGIQSVIDKRKIKSDLARLEKYQQIAKRYGAEFIEEVNHMYIYFRCKDGHFFHINSQLLLLRASRGEDICTVCNPIQKFYSKNEIELCQWIKQNYNGPIKERDRSIIAGEIDIYLPELGLGFEFNGLYWHSELHKDKKYHLNKTESCLKEGIQLIHIWEDDWIYKNEIVKSRILNLLGKSQKVYARKCQIKEVSTKDSKEFLVTNHIQSDCISQIRLGLYLDQKLIGLMTFGKRGLNKEVELLRWCCKLGITIVGGASKLLKWAISKYKIRNVISYADRSWSNGNLYQKLGFNEVAKTGIDYWWVVNGQRSNRLNWSKQKLVQNGLLLDGETEWQCMWRLERYRIYGPGNLKFRLDLI